MTLPTTLVRNRVYVLTDGAYSTLTVSSHAVSGTTRTHIIKCTVADHGGSVTGYTDAACDGQATFTSSGSSAFEYAATGGYLTVDGNRSTSQCGARAAFAQTTVATQMSAQDCGIRFVTTSDGSTTIHFNGTASNSVFKSFEAQGSTGTTTATTAVNSETNGVDGGTCASCTFQYGYIHNHVTQINSPIGAGVIFEHIFFANSKNDGGSAHSNVAFIGYGTDDYTFRFNFATNYDAEGVFVTWFDQDNCPCHVYVYGNVFDEGSVGGTVFPRGVELRQSSSTSGNGVSRFTDIFIYNNTITRIGTGISDRAAEEDPGNYGPGSCTNCFVSNNIGYQSANDCGSGSCSATYSNNTDDSTNRFVGVTTGDFHLTGALAGTSLASPYNTDILGNTRGSDGTFDRGAYEFCSGGCGILTDLRRPDQIWALLGRVFH